MECVEQAEQVEQEKQSECAQKHISLPDNRPNSFHLFHLFHSPGGTEQGVKGGYILSIHCSFIADHFRLLQKIIKFALVYAIYAPT